MAEVKLETQSRSTFGKKNNSLRKSGIVPVNMYGLGESISLQVEEDLLYKTLKEVGFTTPLKISIEASCISGWEIYVGREGSSVGMVSFGKSAPIKNLYDHFNLTSDNIVKVAKKILKK